MKSAQKLSACLIVKNEEQFLANCLASIRDVVDEIVVVDTGSTDRTCDVASTYGATIVDLPWINDFSAARNASLEAATGDWILLIDADETLAPESGAELRKAVDSGTFAGFNAEIVNFTADDNDRQVYVHQAVRLFKKISSEMFSGRIHEQVTPALEQAGLSWSDLPGFQILHHGYRPSMMASRAKLERTIDLLTQELESNPDDSFQWFNLANAYIVSSRWAEAEHAAFKCFATMHEPTDYAVLNFQFLSTALREQGKSAEALLVLSDAKKAGIWNLLLDFEEATTLYKLGRSFEALAAAKRCAEADWPVGLTGDRTIFDVKRWIILGQCLTANGQFSDAAAALAKAGGHPTALYAQATNFELSGNPKQAYDLFTAVQPHAELTKLASEGAGRTALKLGLPQVAAQCFERAWHLESGNLELWTKWVSAAETWGDLTSIVSAYDAFNQFNSPSAAILVNWGRALEASGDDAKALTCYQEAITRDPKDANAHFNLGDLLYRTSQFQDAAHVYEAALRLTPLNAQGWFVLGNSFAQLGIVDGAVIGYTQALTIDPLHEEAKHNLELVRNEAA